jgi:hypothetical protein
MRPSAVTRTWFAHHRGDATHLGAPCLGALGMHFSGGALHAHRIRRQRTLCRAAWT